MLESKEKRLRRHGRVRAKISGTKERPRLSVFFSNNHTYAQLIDDGKSVVLAFANDVKAKKTATGEKSKKGEKNLKAKSAFEVGKLIAQKGLEKKIEKVVFDRGGFKYHGVVKALAEGAREGGLKF
jgi:large subunit ribosomal protein L18